MKMPDLSIIIVNYNVRQYLLDCLQSIKDNCRDLDYEVIVVDNASSDSSAEAVRAKYPDIKLIANDKNHGFAWANNQGYEMSKGEYILLLNPDTIIKPGAVQTVLQFIKDTPDAGLAGCRMLNGNGSLQKSIMNLPSTSEYLSRALFIDRIFFSRHKHETYYKKQPFTIGMPSGAYMFIRKVALRAGDLFKSTGYMYAEEPEICIDMWKRGWKIYFIPTCEIVHFGGSSTSKNEEYNFIELQRGIKHLFSKHWIGASKVTINTAYWLSLFTSTVASILFFFTAKGRRRFRLYFAATRRYPFLKTNKQVR